MKRLSDETVDLIIRLHEKRKGPGLTPNERVVFARHARTVLHTLKKERADAARFREIENQLRKLVREARKVLA